MAERTFRSTLIFFVNGRKVVDPKPNPEHTLIFYLRNSLGLTGTKLGCSEGGCGACTVMVSYVCRKTKKIVHRAVNACLAPVCSVDGMAVTTVEGIGSTRTRLHPIQERLAKSHGSQCGFCTPGIVMSMYALLRTCPSPTMVQIEDAFDGNLCRCTGYRPILSGLQTFASDAGTACCSSVGPSKGCCGGADNGKCCMDNNNAFDSSDPNALTSLVQTDCFAPYEPTQEIIFPPELLLPVGDVKLPFRVTGPRVSWFRPESLQELLAIKAATPEAKIVVGNSEVGIETKFKNVRYPILVAVAFVPELYAIEEQPNGVLIGAALSLTDLSTYLSELLGRIQPYQGGNFRAILENLRWFAGQQIRNVACLGGNLVTASPISDLNPVLYACKSILHISSVTGTRQLSVSDFFLSYRNVALKPQEVITGVFIPFTAQHEYTEAFKQARRRDDDIAIVNAGMRVLLAPQADGSFTVTEASLVYGGVGVTPIFAKQASAGLIGQVWGPNVVAVASKLLEADVPLSSNTPGGMVEYRRSLCSSLFFKFFLMVQNLIAPETVSERDRSAVQRIHRDVSHANQVYEVPLIGKGGIDPVGQPLPHLSAEKQVTGEAIYVDDMPKYAGELYGALVLSTRAHARLISVDATAALSMAGVHGFYSSKDIVGSNKIGPVKHDEECFASTTVICVGAVIGIVTADTQAQAQEAAKAVVIVYENLPAIITIQEAILAKNFFTERSIIKGDTTAGFAQSDHILEGEMHVGGQEHFYLETQACVVVPKGEDGEMEVFASSQGPAHTQHTVADVCGVPANRINVRVKRMGGGFGGKETRANFLVAAVAVAAQHSRRPVRCMLDRDEDMITTGGRHPFLARWKLGFTAAGKIQALEIDMYSNAGYSEDLSLGVMDRALYHLDNAYLIPNVRSFGRTCKTNLPTNTAFRGFGGPQGMIFAENWMTDIAKVCKVNQCFVRELNFYPEGSSTHYNQQVIDSQIQPIWQELKFRSDYDNRVASIAQFNINNRWRKRGIAIIPTKFGVAFGVSFLNQAGALVHLYTDGSVLLTHGGTEMGQGLHTKMQAVCARAFGIPMEQVHITETSTSLVPNSSPTAASASSDLNGFAILNACEQINERLQPFKDKNPNGTLKEWATDAWLACVSLSAAGFYKTPNLGFRNWDTNTGDVFNYYSFGAACCEVEIDVLTGDSEVKRADIVMDVGASLNPAIDIGQVEGAFIQGYGMFTLEEMMYSPAGVTYTRGPGTYKIPGFKDIPVHMTVSLLRNALNKKAVHSSKAVGEPPLFLGSAAFFAIKDAVAAARAESGLDSNSVFRFDSPATSERIRMACVDDFTKQFPEQAGPRWNIVV